MRFWRGLADNLSLPLWALLIALNLVPLQGLAQSASILNAHIDSSDEGLQLNADIEIHLPPAMQDAVRKGVPLYFVTEFQLTRQRWYWLDQQVVTATRVRRISYSPLTDQYRLSIAGISQNVESFDEVRRALSRIRSWTVAEKNRLRPAEKYEASLRFRLDTTQLPKPFQLNIMTSRDWSLASDWYRWNVVAP